MAKDCRLSFCQFSSCNVKTFLSLFLSSLSDSSSICPRECSHHYCILHDSFIVARGMRCSDWPDLSDTPTSETGGQMVNFSCNIQTDNRKGVVSRRETSAVTERKGKGCWADKSNGYLSQNPSTSGTLTILQIEGILEPLIVKKGFMIP